MLAKSQHDPCLRSAPHKAPGEQHPAHSQGGTPHWIPCLAATPTLKYQHSDVLVTKQRHGCRPQSCKCNGYRICFDRTAPEQTHTACMSCTALHEAAHVVLSHTHMTGLIGTSCPKPGCSESSKLLIRAAREHQTMHSMLYQRAGCRAWQTTPCCCTCLCHQSLSSHWPQPATVSCSNGMRIQPTAATTSSLAASSVKGRKHSHVPRKWFCR